jgi:hypothetical protein
VLLSQQELLCLLEHLSLLLLDFACSATITAGTVMPSRAP